MAEVPTPSQTIGPLYGFALVFDNSENAVDPDESGALRVSGRLFDGAGDPVAYPEAMVEVWQGRQWARGRTDEDGVYRVVVRKPDAVSVPDVGQLAPHLNVSIFARGLLKQVWTRMYFPDELEANAADPVLHLVPEAARLALIAVPDEDGLRFDIRLQGEQETPFFVI